MVFHIEYDRTVPERRPPDHQPRAPRHSTRWPKPVAAIISDYFGIQAADLNARCQAAFFARCRESCAGRDGPDCHEIMRSIDEAGHTNAIFVAYWLDPVRHARWNATAPLVSWFGECARKDDDVGAWRETISVPYDRHETIYSESSYRIGIGRTVGSQILPITTNGYFGAARDRLPISAIDELASPLDEIVAQNPPPEGFGQRLRVDAPVNMTTLRSGHYWGQARDDQLDDYTGNIRPRFERGMGYLESHKTDSGTIALRTMTNLDDDLSERREISVYAHFLSLADLERWAKSHKTHLDIYDHAIAMNRKYGAQRQFVSWHELFVLQSATFEYVNCHPLTGLLPFFPAAEIRQPASGYRQQAAGTVHRAAE